MVKRALVFLLFAVVAGIAAARTLYRIELRGASSVISRDLPAKKGSVLVFHRHPDGRMTGVPSEAVVAVSAIGPASRERRSIRLRSSAESVAGTPRPVVTKMEPGDLLVLGPTGEGSSDRGTPDQNTAVAGADAQTGAAGLPQGVPVAPYGFGNAAFANRPGAPNRPVASGGPVGPLSFPPTFDGGGRPIFGTAPSPPAPFAMPNPVPLPLPGSTMSPAGATPPGTTVQPAGTTQPGTTVQPGGAASPRR